MPHENTNQSHPIPVLHGTSLTTNVEVSYSCGDLGGSIVGIERDASLDVLARGFFWFQLLPAFGVRPGAELRSPREPILFL